MTALAVLDRARAVLLRGFFSYGVVRGLCGSREQRLALRFFTGVLGSFAVVLLAPNLALIAAPLVFGVPHLVSELRVLVIRQRLAARMRWLVLGTSLGVGAFLFLNGELAFRIGLLAIALAAWWRRDRAGWVIATVLVIVSFVTAARGMLLVTHGAVSLALWLFVLQKRSMRFSFLAFGTVALAAFACAWKSPDPLLHVTLFLQGLHYVVWLSLVPTPQSFRAAGRAFRKDLGVAGIAIAVVAWLAVLMSSVFDASRARDTYLALAEFHVYVEALLFVHLVRGPWFD